MKRTGVFSLLFLAILLNIRSSQVSAQAPIPITSCQTFWDPGTYVLESNITLDASGPIHSGVCFRFRTPNVTINGQGHTLTLTGGTTLFGDVDSDREHITVKNLVTNGSIALREGANFFTVENSTIHSILLEGADDISITDSVIENGIKTASFEGNPSLRLTFERNTVTSTDYTNGYFNAGSTHPCPRGDFVIRDNTFANDSTLTGSVVSALRINCATHSVVTGNTIRGTGTSIGLYMRDESDDGHYENNSFWSTNGEAIRIASGNEDKTFPSRNIFYNNTFRSDNSPSDAIGFFHLQGLGSGNQFTYNTFVGPRGGLLLVNGSYGNNQFDHNTFYITGAGNYMFWYSYTQSIPDIWTNNIFSYSGTDIHFFENWSFARYAGNHNLFQNRSGSVHFAGHGSSLAAWRSNSGNQDDMNSLEGNPLFGNPGNFDFTIASNSPARGAGSGGTDIGAKPYGSEPPPICTENWSCSAWSTCANSTQTRTCTDLNNCGTTYTRPPLIQDCALPDTTAPATISNLQAA